MEQIIALMISDFLPLIVQELQFASDGVWQELEALNRRTAAQGTILQRLAAEQQILRNQNLEILNRLDLIAEQMRFLTREAATR